MIFKKYQRLVAMTIWFVVLLALPVFNEISHKTLYYIGAILLIPIAIYRIVLDEKFERRFYNKWYKAMEQGFWINVARQGLRTSIYIIVMVTISQFFGHGRTPCEIVSELTIREIVWTVLLILPFSLVAGIVAWYENNKRYYSMKNYKE